MKICLCSYSLFLFHLRQMSVFQWNFVSLFYDLFFFSDQFLSTFFIITVICDVEFYVIPSADDTTSWALVQSEHVQLEASLLNFQRLLKGYLLISWENLRFWLSQQISCIHLERLCLLLFTKIMKKYFTVMNFAKMG